MDAAEPLEPTAFTRRDFLGSACMAGTLIALGIPFAACTTSKPATEGPAIIPVPSGATPPAGTSGIAVNGNTITLDLRQSDTMMLATAGGFLFLEDAHTVVVNAGGTIRAFTSVCTHSGCDVSRHEGEQLVCPCHGSRFSATDGAVQRGPARAALREYPVSQIDRTVTINKA